MIKKFNLLLLFTIATFTIQAQKGPFYPLNGNAHIIEYRKNLPKQNTQILNRTQSTSTVSLILPFYDEFSYAGPYPDPNKWQNSQSVYVNHTKAIAPPTLGVATFDGLNKYGYPYNDNQAIGCNNSANSGLTYPSDTLTSQPIRLDSIPAASQGLAPVDSIYLSFYYQPMGYYDAPETNCTLFLDLCSPLDSSWNNVWNKPGSTPTDSAWHLVMIPIKDTSYFHKNFQFRFRNLSGASGDVDHWHIDVVRVKNSSFYNDTIFPDKSFVYDLPSTLKNYSQMPFRQYSGSADMKSNIGVSIRNNDNSGLGQSITTEYSSFDNTHGNYNYPLQTLNSANLPYYYSAGGGYCNVPQVADPSINFTYPLLSDSNSYTMKFSLHNESIGQRGNDTISFRQIFSNYYAYDDGSAEAGYASCGEPVAVKYTLNVLDTLRAMDIFFDPIFEVSFLKTTSFKIVVWADNGGLPAVNPIYTDTIDRYPFYPVDTIVLGMPQRINTFLRYQFAKPLYLAAGTTFYLGLIPNSVNTFGIGFDKNNNYYQNMFRNVTGTWYVFAGALDPDYTGSLMLRPVFGDSLETLSIKDYTSKTKANFTLYPNPAEDFVTIKSSDNIVKVVVTDILGNLILQQTSSDIKTLNTLSLQSGVYLIKAFTDKGFTDTQKLIIAK